MARKIDDLFDEKNHRDDYFPVKYQTLDNLFTKSRSFFWFAEETDLTEDIKYVKNMSENERQFMEGILSFQANFDTYVEENMEEPDFLPSVKIPEAKSFYRFQIMMEDGHNRAYQYLISNLVTDSKRRVKLLNSGKEIKEIKDIYDWFISVGKNNKDGKGIVRKMIAQCMIEAISFPAGFGGAIWFRKNNKLPGFANLNELISKDENMHCLGFYEIYKNHVRNKLSKSEIIEMIKTLVELTKILYNTFISPTLIGLKTDDYGILIKTLANVFSFNVLKIKVYEKASNPFPWMNLISLTGNTNFFEKRVADYSRLQEPTQGDWSLNEDY